MAGIHEVSFRIVFFFFSLPVYTVRKGWEILREYFDQSYYSSPIHERHFIPQILRSMIHLFIS